MLPAPERAGRWPAPGSWSRHRCVHRGGAPAGLLRILPALARRTWAASSDRAKTLRRKLTSNQPAARRGAALHRAHAAARPDALGFRHIHVDLPTSHLAGHATADADVDWWSPRLGLGFRL